MTSQSGPIMKSATKQKLGPCQISVVSATLSKLNSEAKARTALLKVVYWSGPIALILLVDWYVGLCSLCLSGVLQQAFQCAEIVIAAVLFLSILYDLTVYLSTSMTGGRVNLTSVQKQMLGIKDSDSGYNIVNTSVPCGSFVTTSHAVSNSHAGLSPLSFMTPTSSPYSNTPSPRSCSLKRSNSLPLTSMPSSSPSGIGGSPDQVSFANLSAAYGSQLPTTDYSHSPRKYHVSTRSHSPIENQQRDSLVIKDANVDFANLGIKKAEMDNWCEKCRKWLSQTVIRPLAKEIDSVNKVFCKIGSPELQIGCMNVATLKLVAKSMAQELPSLSALIPYLELSTNQEYLVRRIKELATGSNNISVFRWNSGGTWKGRVWNQDLPNDSQIVMHLLCTYLDSQMPTNPRFPDGRAFSSQYFVKNPKEKDVSKVPLRISEASVNPPHYKVIVKNAAINLPQGRNNLFYAIVLFLYYIKTDEKSLLGQINLDSCGINILWIVSDTTA